MTIMILVLASGEILVGAWDKAIPLWFDSTMRAFVVVAVGAFLLLRKQGSTSVTADRAKF
jgi:hypothetical protein